MEKKSFIIWKWFALLMVLLNVTLIIFLVQPFSKNGPELDKPERGGPAKYILETLKFNKGQAAAFQKLKLAHRDSLQLLNKRGKELREILFEGLENDQQVNNPEQIIIKIGENQQHIERLTYRHFEEVKKLCSPEQKVIFNSIIQEVLKRMGPRRPMAKGEHPDGPPHHTSE